MNRDHELKQVCGFERGALAALRGCRRRHQPMRRSPSFVVADLAPNAYANTSCSLLGAASMHIKYLLLKDVRNWRFRAEEMRTVADGMRDKYCRNLALQIANDYDHLADSAEARSAELDASSEQS